MKNLFFLMVLSALIINGSVTHAANRLLYENFDDQVLDSRLIPRVYGLWGEEDGVNQGDEYTLNQVGYNGKGYCFTSTTEVPKNECFLAWENRAGYTPLPSPWPTNEWYVSFWVRYPTFTKTVNHENIKLFYPRWDGGDSHTAFDDTGGGALYHSEKSAGEYVTNSNWISVPGINDGNWHRVEFYMNMERGISRFWYDGDLKWDKNWGPGTWRTPFSMYYFTFGSIDASGDSIFNRQFDEIEVWDGMPNADGVTDPDPTPAPPEPTPDPILPPVLHSPITNSN
ncbi:MAG: hypothetical protein R2940_10990 [Syntrophotaleaceae bacterium]